VENVIDIPEGLFKHEVSRVERGGGEQVEPSEPSSWAGTRVEPHGFPGALTHGIHRVAVNRHNNSTAIAVELAY
jgi:hypothetical protein